MFRLQYLIKLLQLSIIFKKLMKPAKKGSNQIIVDQYDAFALPHAYSKPSPSTQQFKAGKLSKKIQEEFKDQPIKRYQKEYQERIKPEYPEKVIEYNGTSQNFHEVLSQSDQEQFKMLLQRRHNRDPKPKMKTVIFPKKKEELHPPNPIEPKESQYFPQQTYKKYQLAFPINSTAKRPGSSMVKKPQQNFKQSKKQKQKPLTLKKALSTSKFKEDSKRVNDSVKKQRQVLQSAHTKASQPLKSNIHYRQQVNTQHQQSVSNKLKKKNANLVSKPLRLQEEKKATITQPNKYNKLFSQDQVEKIYFKKSEERPLPRNPLQFYEEEKEEVYSKRKEQVPVKIQQSRRRKRQQSEGGSSAVNEKIIDPEIQLQNVRKNHGNQEQQEGQRSQRQANTRQVRRHRDQPNRERTDIRRQREPARNIHSRNNQRRQRQRRQRPQPQRTRQQQRPAQQQQRRNNRNPPSSTTRRSPNFLNFFSQTINEQLELMNNQFSMMSNIFQNFSNFVNINIDTRGNHFHFSSHIESSDDYDSDSSDSNSSDYDDYYDRESEPEGLNSEELDMIEVIKYTVADHGNNQCTICLVELKTGDEAKKLFCEHLFHRDCIDEWLKRKSDCPVCRDKQ